MTLTHSQIADELSRFLDGAGAAYRAVNASDDDVTEQYHAYSYGVLEGLMLACQHPEWAMYWATLFHDDACMGVTDWMQHDPRCCNAESMTMSPEIVPIGAR